MAGRRPNGVRSQQTW